jgi:hypothetical protein
MDEDMEEFKDDSVQGFFEHKGVLLILFKYNQFSILTIMVI